MDHYIRPPKPDGSLPTNWGKQVWRPSLAPFGDTGNYYLHLYERRQADLNWHNPAVRQEAAAIINFGEQKVSMVFGSMFSNVIGKADKLVDAPPSVASKTLYTDTPIVQDYLKELAANSFGQDDNRVTVGEMSSTTIANSIAYTKPDNHELSMVFSIPSS